LIKVAQHLADTTDIPLEKESFLKHIAYSMLSLYSDHTLLKRKAFTFEELAILVLLLPALKDKAVVAAILSVVTYVCQFFPSHETVLALSATCAATASTTSQLFEARALSLEAADVCGGILAQLCGSLVTICKHDVHCSLLVLRETLPSFVCNTLTQLLQIIGDKDYDEGFVVGVLNHVFTVLHGCLSLKAVETFDEIRMSQVPSLVNSFVAAKHGSEEVLRQILRLHSSLCMSKDESHVVESLQFLTTTTNEFFSAKKYSRVSVIFDALTNILSGNLLTAEVWENLNGFQFIISLLNTLNERFGATRKIAVLEEHLRHLLRSALKCLSVSLSVTHTSVTIKKNHKPINVNKNNKYYSQLSNVLISSGIFQSDDTSAMNVFDMMLGMTNHVPLCLVANPGFVEVVFDVMSCTSTTVSKYAVDVIYTHIKSDAAAKKRMSDIYLVSKIVERFGDRLQDPAYPLHTSLLNIISECCKDYLTVYDFTSLFSKVVCKNILDSSAMDTIRAVPPWRAPESTYHHRPWSGLRLLLDLSSADSIHKAAPFVSFNASTYVMFSVYNLCDICISMWVYIPNSATSGPISVFTLMNEEQTDSLLSFVLDPLDSIFIVTCTLLDTPSHIFKVPTILSSASWHLITINLHKSKGKNASIVSIMFDTSMCEHSGDSDLELRTSTQARKRTVVIGSYVHNETPSESPRPLGPELWRCGTVRVFTDILSSKHVLHCYMGGPGYLGTFKEEDPLQELPSVYSSIALLNFRHKHVTNGHVIDSIGLAGIGLDLISDPTIETTKHAAPHAIDKVVFPPIEFQYAPNYLERITSSDLSFRSGKTATLALCNGAALIVDKSKRASVAVVHNSKYVSPYSESVSSCLAALGGPGVLFPLVHSASNEAELIEVLYLLCVCCKNDATNLKFMQMTGYRTLSFLLSLKSVAVLSLSVVDALLDLSVLHFEDHDSVDCSVLYDATAFYHLFMNHQVMYTDTCFIINRFISIFVDI
jgi:hypothetical protein